MSASASCVLLHAGSSCIGVCDWERQGEDSFEEMSGSEAPTKAGADK